MNRLKTRSIRVNYILLGICFFFLFVIFITFVGKFIDEAYENIKIGQLKNYANSEQIKSYDDLVRLANLENFDVKYYEDGIAYNEHGQYIETEELHVKPKSFLNYDYKQGNGYKYYSDDDRFFLKTNNRYTILEIDNYLQYNILFVIITSVISSVFFFLFILFLLIIFTERYILNRIVTLANYIEEDKDITELNFRVNDELTYLLNSFKKFAKQKEAENESRRVLSSAFSHELKNPLANIKAMVFLYEHSPEVFKDYQDFAKQVNNEVDGITADINHSLEVFDSDGHTSSELVAVDSLINEVIVQNEKLCVHKQIIFKQELTPLTLKTNRTQLMLLVNNIVNNAIKHADEHSTITIHLTEDELICQNEFTNQDGRTHTMGNKLINYTAENLNFSLVNQVDDKVYCVILKFKP